MPGVDLTTIVNAYDDGKSTGAIRRLFNILGPSDVRKNHWHFMSSGDSRDELLRELWNLRLPIDISEGDARRSLTAVCDGALDEHGISCLVSALSLSAATRIRRYLMQFLRKLDEAELLQRTAFTFRDCCIGNMIYAGALAEAGWDIYRGISLVESLLGISARVRPVSPENRWIAALTVSGGVIRSEVEADAWPMSELVDIYLLERALSADQSCALSSLPVELRRARLQQLSKPPAASLRTLSSLRSAAFIVYGPGTLSTSLLPTYLATGVGEAIRLNTSAAKVLITNLDVPNDLIDMHVLETLRYTTEFLARSDVAPGPPQCYVNVILASCHEPWSERLENEIRVIRADFADPYRDSLHNGRVVAAALLGLG